jgi:hypothetical protein
VLALPDPLPVTRREVELVLHWAADLLADLQAAGEET